MEILLADIDKALRDSQKLWYQEIIELFSQFEGSKIECLKDEGEIATKAFQLISIYKSLPEYFEPQIGEFVSERITIQLCEDDLESVVFRIKKYTQNGMESLSLYRLFSEDIAKHLFSKESVLIESMILSSYSFDLNFMSQLDLARVFGVAGKYNQVKEKFNIFRENRTLENKKRLLEMRESE